ncbi:hypothetical protein EYR40_003198 [Pleurotus pulmonarius]|nr:hypothetical protein EYR36_002912 [Pleurotus pulmonarius]KAF4580264.1 hypothetical protein EYR40_003198 [Pleurotus pulmonarius]
MLTTITTQSSMWRLVHRALSVLCPLLPGRVRFRIWKLLCSRGSRSWEPDGQAQRVEGHMYIKLSTLVRPSEGQVTDFVRRNTNIPVPIVIDNVTVDGETALVLSELPGTTVREIHRDSGVSDEQAAKLSRQLARLLAGLRSLPPPASGVCGWGHGPVHCERICMDSKPRGPWSSVDEFHTWMVARSRIVAPPEKSDEVWSCIKAAHSRPHRICLTHNDLASQNILVDEQFNITGIIDWEAAAWMPEYWSVDISVDSLRVLTHRWLL